MRETISATDCHRHRHKNRCHQLNGPDKGTYAVLIYSIDATLSWAVLSQAQAQDPDGDGDHQRQIMGAVVSTHRFQWHPLYRTACYHPSHKHPVRISAARVIDQCVIASTFVITPLIPMTHDSTRFVVLYKCPTGPVVTLIRALALLHNSIPCLAFALTANTSR